MPIATRTRSHIYCNARFYTGVPGLAPIVLWAADGRIRALGGPELLDATPAGPPCIDLQGGFALPGFNVSHLHLLNVWRGLGTIDLFDVRSTAEMARRCADFLRWRGVPARRAVY